MNLLLLKKPGINCNLSEYKECTRERTKSNPLESISDKQLMLQVKSGQLDHLNPLFERYHRPLFRFFCRYGRDVSSSEDLVQTVFLRILKYRHNYTGNGSFKTWLFHIARNVNNDQHRRKSVTEARDLENWEKQLHDPQAGPGDEMIRREELALLRKALQGLSAEQREIIVMSKLQGMPYQSIAELQGCTVGNVKVKVFRAMRSLKQVYAQLDDSRSDHTKQK